MQIRLKQIHPDKILTLGSSGIWLRFWKSCGAGYQKMSKEDPYLDGNCLRIHPQSAFIEFRQDITWSNLYTSKNTSQGGKFRCKRTNKHVPIYGYFTSNMHCTHTSHSFLPGFLKGSLPPHRPTLTRWFAVSYLASVIRLLWPRW